MISVITHALNNSINTDHDNKTNPIVNYDNVGDVVERAYSTQGYYRVDIYHHLLKKNINKPHNIINGNKILYSISSTTQDLNSKNKNDIPPNISHTGCEILSESINVLNKNLVYFNYEYIDKRIKYVSITEDNYIVKCIAFIDNDK